MPRCSINSLTNECLPFLKPRNCPCVAWFVSWCMHGRRCSSPEREIWPQKAGQVSQAVCHTDSSCFLAAFPAKFARPDEGYVWHPMHTSKSGQEHGNVDVGLKERTGRGKRAVEKVSGRGWKVLHCLVHI